MAPDAYAFFSFVYQQSMLCMALVLGAVEREVRHVPVAAALELVDILRLARRHVIVIVAEPVVYMDAIASK
jgi:hypothetical protein